MSLILSAYKVVPCEIKILRTCLCIDRKTHSLCPSYVGRSQLDYFRA